MKRIIFTFAALAAFALSGMTDTERQYLRNLAQRPRCEERKQVVIGGVTNIVETWRRDGYEWKQTNAVRRIIGKTQTNTFEQRLAEMRELAAQWRETATNATARIERVSATLDEKRAEYVAKRDAVTLPTTKAIYQAFIDAIDRIKEKLDEEGKE